MMQFYFVKDLEEVKSMCTSRLNGVEGEELRLNFSDMILEVFMLKTVDQSGPRRDFAGKVKDAVKSENTYYHLYLSKRPTELVGVLEHEPGCAELFQEIFGKENVKISISLSICYLATEDTPVSPQALLTLDKNMELIDNDGYGFKVRSIDEGDIEEVQKLWDHEDGFIYSKLTVVVTVNEDGVKMFRENSTRRLKQHEEMHREMLETEFCSDLEIRCRDGKLVKCHRSMLGGRSAVFKAMFQEDRWKDSTTSIVKMEEMSEASVRALLGWMYWNDEEKPLLDSDLAVELLVAGDRYNVGGLVERMKEIILDRRGYEEQWFTEESAQNLLEWAEKLEGMKELKDKAEQIIKFFGIEVIENGTMELSLDN